MNIHVHATLNWVTYIDLYLSGAGGDGRSKQ